MKVYLAGTSTIWCKIGVAKRPSYRVSVLDATKLPFKTFLLAEYDAGDSAYFVEKNLHQYFSSSHVRGEWFKKKGVDKDLFMSKAYEFHQSAPAIIPNKARPDIYEGTRWGKLSSHERVGLVIAAKNNPEILKTINKWLKKEGEKTR